ncbi:MAG: 4-hydroxythreonine-4-phosphate dehydrogenase PdxA [Hyphomicrobiales bacterium]|nr:4-hydroxythreonine-4-phosphate dehydrogenase PdxA [Hyphomicrobiales bacterium]
MPLPVAVTMGDPAGIGPDITLAAWASAKAEPTVPFMLLSDPEFMRGRAEILKLDMAIEEIAGADDALKVFPRALPVLPVALQGPIVPGQPEAAAVPAILSAIERAVELVYQGEASALVTNPINKKLLYDSGFDHPGHTEFLGALAQSHGDTAEPVMMLACDELRAVPATIHIPVKDVAAALSVELLVATIRTTAQALSSRFGISSPRIAVTGLNPHAGEQGAIGDEEKTIIVPAIEILRGENINVSGPSPADTIFQEPLRSTYDAVVTMYHDQALIPVKILAFDRAVNITLGLPFVRTSPDHGTAYDLAGTGRADPASLIEALKLAHLLGAQRGAAA